MRLGNYTLEWGPSKGWEGVRRAPRMTISPTLGGVVATILQGHVGDEVVTVPFDLLDATPARTQVRSYAATDVVADTITAGQMLAYKIPVVAGGFAAISAARIRLKQTGMVGEARVEVWDTSAGEPNERVGLLGVLMATDIGAAFADLDVFADCAWPIGASEGWLVVNGTEMTAGTLSWAGEVAVVNAHAKASPYPGSSLSGPNPSVDMTGDPTENKLRIIVDGTGPTREVTFNWAGCNTGALIATQMQTKIRALGGVYALVTVTYDHAPPVDHYTITSNAVGEGSSVHIFDAPANNCCDELHLGVANGGYEPEGGVTWALANGELCGTVWQGGQCLVLRGLVGAYGMKGESLEVDLDDGQLYDALLAGMSAAWRLTPTALEDRAHAAGVRLTLALIGER